jgi:hypothetical protein
MQFFLGGWVGQQAAQSYPRFGLASVLSGVLLGKSFCIGNLKFLVQSDKLKQGCTNEIQENYVGRKRGNFSAAL